MDTEVLGKKYWKGVGMSGIKYCILNPPPFFRYGYDWKEEEAEKLLLRTHTTAVSSCMLYKLAQEVEMSFVKIIAQQTTHIPPPSPFSPSSPIETIPSSQVFLHWSRVPKRKRRCHTSCRIPSSWGSSCGCWINTRRSHWCTSRILQETRHQETTFQTRL